MSTEALRALYAALNRGDIDAVLKDFDPGIVWISLEMRIIEDEQEALAWAGLSG